MSDTNNPCIIEGKCASPTNLPEFIDTSACLCGLLNSRQTDPNGGLSQLWRCIGNASDNIANDENGKWYNTMLPSEELSGINQPQNWAENGPDLSQTYVLVDKNGQPAYEKLGSNGSPSLIGADKDCTGKNDTQLSTKFYSHSGENGTSNGMGSSVLSASASSSAKSTLSSGSNIASSTVTASSTTPSSIASSSTSSTASPSISRTSDATRGSMKAMFLIGMLLTPLVTF